MLLNDKCQEVHWKHEETPTNITQTTIQELYVEELAIVLKAFFASVGAHCKVQCEHFWNNTYIITSYTFCIGC